MNLSAIEYITMVVVTINSCVIKMVRCLYGSTGKNVRWRGKHQNLGEIWNGASFHNFSIPAPRARTICFCP